MTAVLQVTDLRKAYSGVHALDGVSFEVAAGSITGLIGPAALRMSLGVIGFLSTMVYPRRTHAQHVCRFFALRPRRFQPCPLCVCLGVASLERPPDRLSYFSSHISPSPLICNAATSSTDALRYGAQPELSGYGRKSQSSSPNESSRISVMFSMVTWLSLPLLDIGDRIHFAIGCYGANIPQSCGNQCIDRTLSR